MAPLAAQRATFEKQRCSDSITVVDLKTLKRQNSCFRFHSTSFQLLSRAASFDEIILFFFCHLHKILIPTAHTNLQV